MSEKEMNRKKPSKIRWVTYVPIIVLLGIIPLIVQLVKTEIPNESILYVTNNNIDLFSQTKSTWIMIMVGAILLLGFLGFSKDYIKKDNVSKLYYISTSVYVIMTLTSTLMSDYDYVTKWGMPNRAEGGVMLICYMIIMLYTYSIVTDTKDYKYLLVPLGILVVIQAIIGYYQYIGEDLLMTEWGKQIIIPEHYAEDRANLQPLYKDGNMYGTMFHYNYIGSFTAMLVPLFVLLAAFVKDYRWKIFCAVSAVASIFLLFGSTARSGIIGLVCSILVGILLFSRYFIKRWKVCLSLIVVCAGMVVGLDIATDGAIFSRIPTLLNDMLAIVQPTDQTFDYKQTLPLQGITHDNGTAILHMDEGKKLHVRVEEERIMFENELGQEIVYIYMNLGPSNEQYFTQDERYVDWKFVIDRTEGIPYAQLVYQDMYICTFTAVDEVHLVNHFTREPMELTEALAWGFKGKEKLGSARGYIWSRTLPMLKETWLVGIGPDAYGLAFPQDDILGKWHAYGDPNMVVDKPHNLYLQIAIQQGVVALVAFVVLVATYLVQCIKLYGFKKDYEQQHIIGMGLMLAVVGYLGAGFFNDSVVSVAPIFWILLGAGMAVNYLIKEQVKDKDQQ